MFKFESGDKNIRDIIEGPPRMETPKAEEFINQDNLQENIMPNKVVTPSISKESAHKFALSLLSNTNFCLKLKEIISEKLVKKERITRLDKISNEYSEEEYEQTYGFTDEHIADIKNGNFLIFNLVKDGDDLAITFKKKTGDIGIRTIDDQILAEMLNRILSLHPELDLSKKEKISLN